MKPHVKNMYHNIELRKILCDDDEERPPFRHDRKRRQFSPFRDFYFDSRRHLTSELNAAFSMSVECASKIAKPRILRNYRAAKAISDEA